MNPGIDTSIVLTTCSRAPSLARLLDSLLPGMEASPFSVELVVVDDGSTDNTAQVLQSFVARTSVAVRTLPGASQGVAAARNLGLHAARGTWIAFCDDDQIALPGWLAALRHAAETTGADIVGGPLTLHLPAPFRVEDYGPRAQRLLGFTEATGDVRPYAAGHAPATNNVLLRAATVRALRGFDVRFTEGGEDADLFERAARYGAKLAFQPAAVMIHMLTERRLTRDGLRWAAQRVGAGEARVRRGNGGVALFQHMLQRIAILCLRDLPQLAFSRMRGNSRAITDTLCSIWYTAGLLRTAAALGGSAQQTSAFLRRMDFRQRNGERPNRL